MSGDVEWLDDDHPDDQPDEELPGSHRPPMRRRTVLVLGGVGVAAVVAAAVVGVSGGSDDTPRSNASPARTVTLDPSDAVPVTPQVGDVSSALAQPFGPPRAAVTAIKAAFPGADLTSYVSVKAKRGESRPTDFYNLSVRNRRVTVIVAPQRPEDDDGVFRTATSVEIGQQLGPSTRVDVKVTTAKGSTTQLDFESIQTLVQDGRLLARPGRGTMSR